MPGWETPVEPWLSLFRDGGIKSINLRKIDSFRFTNPRIAADLSRVLDLIAAFRNSLYRDLTVSLPGSGSRPVSVSYVIPAPAASGWTFTDVESRETTVIRLFVTCSS
jgi:hypothetical protein